MPASALTRDELGLLFEYGFVGPFPCEAPLEALRPDPTLESLNRHLTDEACRQVTEDESIVGRLASIFGAGGVSLFKTRFWVKPAGDDRRVPWHQDVGHNNGGFDERGEPVPTVTVWLALDGCSRTQGGLRVVPGSHRRLVGDWRRNIAAGLERTCDPRDIRVDEAVDLKAAPGWFFLFHSWILHGSERNASRRRRACLNMRFVAAGDAREPQYTYRVLRPVEGPWVAGSVPGTPWWRRAWRPVQVLREQSGSRARSGARGSRGRPAR